MGSYRRKMMENGRWKRITTWHLKKKGIPVAS